MSLADLLNAPPEFEHGGVTYRPRKLTTLDLGKFQRRLELRARQAIDRATDLTPEARAEQLRLHFQDVAAGVYGAGSVNFYRAVEQPDGCVYVNYLALTESHPDLTEDDVAAMFWDKRQELLMQALRAVGDGGKASSRDCSSPGTTASGGSATASPSAGSGSPGGGADPASPSPSSEASPPSSSSGSTSGSGTNTGG